MEKPGDFPGFLLAKYAQAYFDLLRHGEKNPVSGPLPPACFIVDLYFGKCVGNDATAVLQTRFSGLRFAEPFELAGVTGASGSILIILE